MSSVTKKPLIFLDFELQTGSLRVLWQQFLIIISLTRTTLRSNFINRSSKPYPSLHIFFIEPLLISFILCSRLLRGGLETWGWGYGKDTSIARIFLDQRAQACGLFAFFFLRLLQRKTRTMLKNWSFCNIYYLVEDVIYFVRQGNTRVFWYSLEYWDLWGGCINIIV